MNKYSIQKRNSSVEFIKLIACLLIVFSHSFPRGIPTEAAPYLIDPTQATGNLQVFLLIVLKYLGQVGNAVFIVSSAFFLRRSSAVKMRKVFDIVRDSFLISLFSLIVLLLIGWRFPLSTMVKQLIPITMNTNWFVGCYLLFYLIHPALNRLTETLDQRKLLGICIAVIILYCGINFLLPGRFYYTQLVGFINIYLLVSYADLYLPSWAVSRKGNAAVMVSSLVMLFGLIWTTNFLGLRIGALSGMADWFSNISNPLIIAVGISAFGFARTFHFESRTINSLSSLTLLIYLIHANDLIMDFVKPVFFANVYMAEGYGRLLYWCGLFGLMLLIGGVLLSVCYRFLADKLLVRISDRIWNVVVSGWNRLLDAILSWS